MPTCCASRRRARFVSVIAALITAPLMGQSMAVAAESAADPSGTLEPVVVTAALRPTDALALPASVTVLDTHELQSAGQTHLEDVLSLVPNLNFAAGTNRARYFQLRGIGELDQYEGAPNPSVGLLVDEIDFSGLGSMATLFDLDRIEVLRGPQGTRYGANALAGLLYLTSAAPEPKWGSRLEVGAGNYGTRSIGAVLTGPVTELDSSFRLAAEHYTSNGFYRNDYLQRNDTNGRDVRQRDRRSFRPARRHP
jgi:outer membrane receptor protein involved in Fe transport